MENTHRPHQRRIGETAMTDDKGSKMGGVVQGVHDSPVSEIVEPGDPRHPCPICSGRSTATHMVPCRAAPAREGVDTLSVLVMAVQDAEQAFRKTQSMGDLRHPDLAKYAELQTAIKAAVVAARGSWK